MKKKYTYSSAFSSYFEKFLEFKILTGLNSTQSMELFLSLLDRFFIMENISKLEITEEIILRWNDTRKNDSVRTFYTYTAYWREFCMYLCGIGVQAYIPRLPRGGWKNNYEPYIFSKSEVELLFASVDELKIIGNSNTTSLFAMPVLIRLLYSTGMRISEALALRNEDVDLRSNTILIRKTKNGDQRIAAINDSLKKCVIDYIEFKTLIPLSSANLKTNFFFITQLGKKCNGSNIRKWFHKAVMNANIPSRNFVNYPRIHDLRHTAAVHCMEGFSKSGLDSYNILPLISLFLGHKNLRSTERYLRMTSEIFPDIIAKQKELTFVFPDMKFINASNKNINQNDNGFC